jgi:hypothetical protein
MYIHLVDHTCNSMILQMVSVNIAAGTPPDGSKCVASGLGMSTATAGATTSFLIQAVDARGVYMAAGGAFFIAELLYLNDYFLLPCKDNSDGTYTVSVYVTKSATYQLFMSLGGVPIAGSPFSLDVLPASVSLIHTAVTGTGLTSGMAGAMGCFEIQARDQFSNAQIFNGDSPTFGVRVQGPGNVVRPVTFRRFSSTAHVAYYSITASGVYAVYVDVQGASVTIGPKALTVSFAAVYACVRVCLGLPCVRLCVHVVYVDVRGMSVTIGPEGFDSEFCCSVGVSLCVYVCVCVSVCLCVCVCLGMSCVGPCTHTYTHAHITHTRRYIPPRPPQATTYS